MQVDKQTLLDLEIIKNRSKNESGPSILDYLDRTRTEGGRYRLAQIVQVPKSDIKSIVEFQVSLKFILKHSDKWSFINEITADERMESISRYLRSNVITKPKSDPVSDYFTSIYWSIFHQDIYQIIYSGVINVFQLIDGLKDFYYDSSLEGLPGPIQKIMDVLGPIYLKGEFSILFNTLSQNRNSAPFIFQADRVFRNTAKETILQLEKCVYEIDAMMSLSLIVYEKKLVFPRFIDSETPQLKITGLYHPYVKDPVKNDFSSEDGNFVFLTGPNMGGKTTFMKAAGIAVYLAHIGMAVPAEKMSLSLFDRLYSGINTIDNIQMGYSYFYSEVLRVKEIAELLVKDWKSFVLFDELFKGTNVSEAYEASKRVILGLARSKNAFFVVSSHLVELENDIKQKKNISFYYFDAEIVDHKPVYHYLLKKGVSTQKLGLLLLENEDVFKILEQL